MHFFNLDLSPNAAFLSGMPETPQKNQKQNNTLILGMPALTLACGMHTSVQTFILASACMHAYLHTRTHTHTHVYTQTDTYRYKHVYMIIYGML